MTYEDLLNVAAREAEAGRKVLWFTGSRLTRAEAHRRLAQSMPSDVLKKVYVANDDKRITTIAGGQVVFISVGSHAGRGHTADTLIFDDTPVHPYALTYFAGSADGRVYISDNAPHQCPEPATT